ncbi:MAG: glycosyltransferase family 4 protein [Clostridiales bacterium]|nr:glycosyltransferase family 4 protein [Clostridiales bacterium]
MRIAMFINDQGFVNKHLNNPRGGNPGVGGTQFEFAMLAQCLSQDDRYEVLVIHLNDNNYPKNCKDIIVNDLEDAIRVASKEKVDYLIVQANLARTLYYIEQYKVDTILWVHNFLRPNKVIQAAKCMTVRKIVAVGDFEYRYMRLFTSKAGLAYNMISPLHLKTNRNSSVNITYIGSIIPPKGFHILADAWFDILNKIPNAQLHVIGSSHLYDSATSSDGLSSYEEHCISALSQNGKLHPSVHLHGVLGVEKYNVIITTTVGVVNPSGKSETFGLSALDFSSCGVPVVGNMPTIKNKKNGYRVHSKKELIKSIVRLCNDEHLRNQMGQEGKRLASAYYPENVMPMWDKILS